MFGETERSVVDCKQISDVNGGPSYRSSRCESRVDQTAKRKPIKFKRRKLHLLCLKDHATPLTIVLRSEDVCV